MCKKIAIIAQGIIPIVTAGAVETLTTTLVEENEKENKCVLTIYSVYDNKARKRSMKYNNTKFIYIKINLLYKIIFKIRKYFFSMLHSKNRIVDPYIYSIYKDLKKNFNKYDYVVIEHGGHLYGYKNLYNLLGSKLYYHSHTNEIPIQKPLYKNIIAISEFCRKPWLTYFNSKDVVLLHNGIDIRKFKAIVSDDDKIKLRKKYGIDKNDFLIIFCGRILKEKGVLELVNAVNNIENNDIKLIVVGGLKAMGNKDEKYVKTVHMAADKSKGKIIFTGHVDNEKLYKYYQMSNIQCVPSICEEGAGLVAIEGMATGLALIITKSGGMPEYVTDKCSLIIPNNNMISLNLKKAIMKLYNDRKLCKTLGENAQKRANRFSAKNFYHDFINIFDNTVRSVEK